MTQHDDLIAELAAQVADLRAEVSALQQRLATAPTAPANAIEHSTVADAAPRGTSRRSLLRGAAAATAAAAVSAATAAAARGALLRLVHFERASVEERAVELCDGCACGLRVAHGHEREAARLSGLAIGRHRDLTHLAASGEGSLDGCLVGREREVSDVEAICHVCFFRASLSTRGCSVLPR